MGTLVCLAFSGMASGIAVAADLHAFDAALSLTGDCSVSELDPVPDPPIGNCPAGPHPPAAFSKPTAVTVDQSGDVYVASFGQTAGEAHIDVFSAGGKFLTELAEPNRPRDIAVDAAGNLYVFSFTGLTNPKIRRYPPTKYTPASGEIEYTLPPVTVAELGSPAVEFSALAVNPLNQHLFSHQGLAVVEYGSAAEGNPVLTAEVGKVKATFGAVLAIDAVRGRIYASSEDTGLEDLVIRVLQLAPPHNLIETIENGCSSEGTFFTRRLTGAVDEGTGHLFISENQKTGTVYELTEHGQCVSTITHGFDGPFRAVAVDNGAQSPHGVLDPEGRYLWVPSGVIGAGHAFAFGPSQLAPPDIESVSVSGVTETEAELTAVIHPGQLPTAYEFEYVTRGQFEETGFSGARNAGGGTIPAGGTPVTVTAAVSELTPGTGYVFRVVATNEEGSAEETGEFTTYPAVIFGPCPNDAFRTGPSALLPDCRAYELVTPPDTNARAPLGVGHNTAGSFATRQASPDGNRVSFRIEGGLIPGFSGTGSFAGDPYLSSRASDGWQTIGTGPDGEEAVAATPGSSSPDQGFSFWNAGGGGTAFLNGGETDYVRYPDGHSALVGRGAFGVDTNATGKLIAENGEHIIFLSDVQLEPDAPPDGTNALYDRTPDEVTHVVSLLPGDLPIPAGEKAFPIGTSLDGRGVAFGLEGSGDPNIYLRHQNDETFVIPGPGLTFAGIAEGGSRIFYLKGGNLFAFDIDLGTIPFTTSGDVRVVNVSANGAAAYFVSPSVLTGTPNPEGDLPQVGAENLYVSREGAISFVGTVTDRDVDGENKGNGFFDGLGLWTGVVGPGDLAKDPSRVTPDGSAIVFQSRADLTGYESEGFPQVYRYDGAGLICLSCNPTGAPASSGASLQSVSQDFVAAEPLGFQALVPNLNPAGTRAFFQSEEALVPGDTDGLQDVYEWESPGVGSCTAADGCVYLISSGHSSRTDYIFGVSDSGNDVFFRSADLLVPADADETPSVYDARVGGGFPELLQEGCEGEGCRPQLSVPPALSTPGSATGKSGNVGHRCPKTMRKVKRHGKVRCIKKHRRNRHRHHSSKNGGSK